MNKQPLVTIAIPAYKKKYIKEAIDSALNQDYKNIEVIIVNDKSPYNLKDIIDQYEDNRIIYYENERNIGKHNPVNNWNRCIELAKGDFFTLLCDDDILMPNFVSELLKLADKYKECNVFHARRIIKNESTGETYEDELWPEWENAIDIYKNKRWHTISEFLYRTERVKECKYIPLPMAWGADDISIINFAAEGGMVSSKNCLAMFRFNDEHISKEDTHMVEKAKARIEEAIWFSNFFTQVPYHPDYINHLDILMIEFIRRVNYIDKFRILLHVPNQVWSWKHKCAIALHILKGEYTHPGYRYPGC